MSGRRRRRAPAARLRPFWFVGTAALLVAVAAGYFLMSWPGFRAKHVRVIGNSVVPAQEILARARIEPHGNVWLQNTAAVARRIETIPYVLTARVHRLPPADVTIVVTERRPLAIVQSGGEMATVDLSLRVLETGASDAALPVLVVAPGVDLRAGKFVRAPSALALRTALLSLRAHGVSVQRLLDDRGDVDALLPGGVRVLLGDETNVAGAVALVEPILTRFALLGRFVGTLDLRSPTTPVVTERGSARPRAARSALAPTGRRSP
ncbi:MAG TPA: FtsQ-type POTRA domain-containing protein [Candidatus Dormibacteraeota bacterium]|nr:FtsQ-type POTRA domain-containing protein [Candidatus Dormibacteraeota bacterium]